MEVAQDFNGVSETTISVWRWISQPCLMTVIHYRKGACIGYINGYLVIFIFICQRSPFVIFVVLSFAISTMVEYVESPCNQP